MIKNLLNEAKSQFHRVPKVIEPVLISIYSEISLRMKNLDKVKNLIKQELLGVVLEELLPLSGSVQEVLM